VERSAEYVAERASAGNAIDIAMMAFLVNYDGIVIKALHSGDDEGSAAPDMRYLSATSTFIPALASDAAITPLPYQQDVNSRQSSTMQAVRLATTVTTTPYAMWLVRRRASYPSPDDMRRDAATRLRDLVAATRDSRVPFSLNGADCRVRSLAPAAAV